MKKFVLIFTTFVMLMVILLCAYLQDRSSFDTVRFVVSAVDDVTQNINLFHKDGKYYVFLPSYADVKTMKMIHKAGCSFYLDGKSYGMESSFADIILGKEYAAEMKGTLTFAPIKEKIIFMKAENIATLSISLDNGTIDDINANKELAKAGSATLIKADTEINYSGSFQELHGRGNSSWGQQKKPYALEFTEEVELLNMGKHTSYILVANAMDESGLRNKIVYDAAETIGLPNSVKSEYIDLYVDGNYLGLYLLTNKISIFENSITASDLLLETQMLNQYPLETYETFEKDANGIYMKGYSIPNDPEDISGSYLVEFELDSRTENEGSLFTTASGQHITVKVPKYASKKQMEYISSYIQNIENLLGSEEVRTIVDEESWTRYYLLQEVFANISRTSFFFYKDPDAETTELISGPIWDFDLSMGTNYNSENALPYQLYCNWGWYEMYHRNASSLDLTKERYINEIRPLIQEIVSTKIDEYQKTISKSYLMNEMRWEGIQYNWWVNHYETQEDHSEYLKLYLSERLKYLDHLWLGTEAPETIMKNESAEPIDHLSSTTAPLTKLDRFHMLLNNEQHYLKAGTSLLIMGIFISVLVDTKDLTKLRRYRNGRKQ